MAYIREVAFGARTTNCGATTRWQDGVAGALGLFVVVAVFADG